MARKKAEPEKKTFDNPKVVGLHSEVLEQPITQTLETNFMPYAMSVIVSRAIPDIDGFKPAHRKLLYTMFKMGLLNGPRQKSANIVGQTMKLNPHGDAAIYDTMVRLSAGHEALLTPFVESKGNFGKVYSRDMSYAASRYTEARLAPICNEIFRDIDKDTVDFDDSYDGTQKEPRLLPTAFPNVLVSANLGIAVGMASQICGFNLNEVCRTAVAYLRDPECDLFETLPAPDFPTGGDIIFDRSEMEIIYKTGRGGFRVRAKWRYVQKENIIEIYEIPYTTTVELIIDKIVELSKQGKVREINDIRDETDLSGLRIAIDLKRGTDPDKLMQKLFKMTTLQDTFSCNFNILVAGSPRVMGVRDILDEWTAWRIESTRRRIYYDLQKKMEKLHLLKGLERILLDIDKAIKIIRNTEEEAKVVPNLMEGFGIDEVQAEYVAEIRLRHLNREYILRRTDDISQLEKDIEELESILASSRKIKNIIIRELSEIAEKYGQPRRSMIIYAEDIIDDEIVEEIPDYAVNLFFSKEGYFKKITPQSLRMSGEHKLKDGDEITEHFETTNNTDLIFISDHAQAYKAKGSDFADTKTSVLGEYIPSKLGFDEDENAIYMIPTKDYSGYVMFFFESGKAAKVPLESYATKTNRKKLTGAYCDKEPLAAVCYVPDDETDIVILSSSGRALVFKAGEINAKSSRTAQGVAVMKQKKGHRVISAKLLTDDMLPDKERYRSKTLPSMGQLPKSQDSDQMTF